MRGIRTACAGLLLAASASAENIRLTIYHTSDIHGWIMARPASWYKQDPKRVVGGFPALARAVRADKGPRLLLDSGDWFQGTPEGSATRGQTMPPLFNALGYDAVLIGNHDFDYGQERLRELVGRLKMPALGANIRDAKTHERVSWAAPDLIKDIEGVRVGIFGVTYQNMKAMTFPKNIEGLEFRRAVDEARDAVKDLKAQGATVIIALTHLGFESPEMGIFEGDQTLAREAPGIDAILGGHTHKFIKDPPHEGATLITEPGYGLSACDKVTLEIDPVSKKVVSSKGEALTLWIDELGQDPEVLAMVRADEEEAGKVFDVVIGTAAEDIERGASSEGALDDWFTDCVRGWSGADVALFNGAGIRGRMGAGPVTLRTIYDIMPYDNRPVKLTLTGAQLLRALDHGAALGAELVQQSGATFAYKRRAADGQRISRLRIGGKPVDPKKEYTLETSDFLVNGGDGFPGFKDARQETSPVLLREVLRQCVEKNPLVKAPRLGRMISLEDTHGPEKRAR